MTGNRIVPICGRGMEKPLFRKHLPFVGESHDLIARGEETYATNPQATG